MNLNSSPSPFPIHHQIISNDHDQQYMMNPFGPNPSSVSCHIFFNNSTQHHMEYYHDHHPQLYQLPQHISDDNTHGGSTYHEIKNNKDDQSGLKLTLWKKEEDHGHEENTPHNNNNNNQVKWMSSKMRLMQKMKKNPDRVTLKITNSSAKNKLEDQKEQQIKSSSSLETDLSSNSSSYTNNSPIRVCSDCNTTKTPLWRSGPKGPKSLCNACGIRQRKARRAMAAAAAAASGAANQPPAGVKIKVHQKEKMAKNNGNASHLKKRLKTTITATTEAVSVSLPSDGQKKLGFEDFLINLSKNLSFHRVFPEDERDAAILLMALSSGLVN